MKQVIDGLIYDTDKSELIYTDKQTGYSYYKSPTGKLFYHDGSSLNVTNEDAVFKELNKDGEVDIIQKFFPQHITGQA